MTPKPSTHPMQTPSDTQMARIYTLPPMDESSSGDRIERAVEMYLAGSTLREILAETGVRQGSLYPILAKRGIPLRREDKAPPLSEPTTLELLARIQALAERTGELRAHNEQLAAQVEQQRVTIQRLETKAAELAAAAHRRRATDPPAEEPKRRRQAR